MVKTSESVLKSRRLRWGKDSEERPQKFIQTKQQTLMLRAGHALCKGVLGVLECRVRHGAPGGGVER